MLRKKLDAAKPSMWSSIYYLDMSRWTYDT